MYGQYKEVREQLFGKDRPMTGERLEAELGRRLEMLSAGRIVIPHDPTLMEIAPWIDPKEAPHPVAMDFAKRIDRVKAELERLPQENRTALEAMLDAMEDPNAPLFKPRQEMLELAQTISNNELKAKICPNEEYSRQLWAECQQRSDPSSQLYPVIFRNMDRLVQTMEQVAGLRPGTLEEDGKEQLRAAGFDAVEALSVGAEVEKAPGRKVDVHLSNVRTMLEYNWSADPQNWGKPLPEDLLGDMDTKQIQKAIDDTVTAKVAQELGGLMEDAQIKIADRNVEEYLRQEHRSAQTGQTYEQWYARNGKDRTAQLVAAAMIAGKNVTALPYDGGPQIEVTGNVTLTDGTVRYTPDDRRTTEQRRIFDPYRPTFNMQWEMHARTVLKVQHNKYFTEMDRQLTVAPVEPEPEPEPQPRRQRPEGNFTTVDSIYQWIDPQDIQQIEQRKQTHGASFSFDPRSTANYPGMDPTVADHRISMDYMHRIAKVLNVAKALPAENQQVLGHFAKALAGPRRIDNQIYDRYVNMQQQADLLGTVELSSQLCRQRDPQFSQKLQRTAQICADPQSPHYDPQFRRFDDVIETMEKVAGLRAGAISQEGKELIRSMGIQPSPTMAVGGDVRCQTPTDLQVRFYDMEKMLRHDWAAHPENAQRPFDLHSAFRSLNEGALDRKMDQYGQAAVQDTLGPMFDMLERNSGNKVHPTSANRGTLIAVDGMTVEEHMSLEYQAIQGDKPDYEQWYAQNLDQRTNSLIAAALMKGQRVETYIPGADGKLPKEPTLITRAGFEPTPVQPVFLNAWERFFNRHGGHYAEKARRAEAYQQHLQRTEQTRQRIEARYQMHQISRMEPGNKTVSDMFFGNFLRAHQIPDMQTLNRRLPAGHPYRVDRSAASTACICMMAAQGYDLEEILDPTKLVEQKQTRGRLYLEQAGFDVQTGRLVGQPNAQWLGSVYYHGVAAMTQQLDRIMQGVDLTDKAQREKYMPTLAVVAQTLLDCHQEQSFVGGDLRLGFYRAAGGGDAARSAIDKADDISSFINELRHAVDARGTLGIESNRAGSTVADIVSLAMEKDLLAQYASAPGATFSQRTPPAYRSTTPRPGISSNMDILELRRYGGPQWQKLSELAINGTLADQIDVHVEPENRQRVATQYDLQPNQLQLQERQTLTQQVICYGQATVSDKLMQQFQPQRQAQTGGPAL